MYENIDNILSEFVRAFGDTRETIFEVKFDLDSDGRGIFWGKVLEMQQIQALQAAVFSLYPAGLMNFSEIKVLRKSQNPQKFVITNLTGLHAEPSFHSGLTSQLLLGTPVEVLEQTDQWAFVRLRDGYLGWTYRRYLTEVELPTATHIICKPTVEVHQEISEASVIKTRLFAGSLVAALKFDSGRVLIQTNETGWLAENAIREVSNHLVDIDQKRQQIIADAACMIGVPYLSGGTSANGIDCSGLTQLIYALNGISIRRDADLQALDGSKKEPPFLPGDLVFFGGDQDANRSVSHIGISLGGWKILHSSRYRNGVSIDNIMKVTHLREKLISSCTYFY